MSHTWEDYLMHNKALNHYSVIAGPSSQSSGGHTVGLDPSTALSGSPAHRLTAHLSGFSSVSLDHHSFDDVFSLKVLIYFGKY